jgi:hypothetical protein
MCENKVGFWVPRGYDYRETWVKCGRTDPWGGRAVCDTCASDPAIAADIERAEATIAADNAASRSAGWGDW